VTRALRRARDLPTSNGALVNHVEKDGPADEAGLERGDVIIELDRNKLDGSSELIELLRDRKPGARVDVVVLRDGKRNTFKVKLGKRPKNSLMFVPGGRNDFDFEFGPMMEHLRENRSELHSNMEELREQMQELKEELRELRQELREARRGRSGSR